MISLKVPEEREFTQLTTFPEDLSPLKTKQKQKTPSVKKNYQLSRAADLSSTINNDALFDLLRAEITAEGLPTPLTPNFKLVETTCNTGIRSYAGFCATRDKLTMKLPKKDNLRKEDG